MKNKLKNSSVKPNSNNNNNISKEFLQLLPEIEREVMKKRTEKTNFKEKLVEPEEYDGRWQQFEIISHTEASYRSYDVDVQQYFKEWSLESKIDSKMDKQIYNKNKRELLAISHPFHNIRKLSHGFIETDGKLEPIYYQQEAKSESLIKENQLVYHLLKETYKLTEDQTDYIARAGLHFELGKAKDVVKKTNLGFTIAFANSEECKKISNEISIKHPPFRIEIGILFSCDRLAKTDTEIEQKHEHINQIIKKLNFNPKLKAAIKQLPANIEIRKRCIKAVCEKPY